MQAKQKFNILVGQSGGPTAVINASLYGVIQEGLAHPERIGTVYGMINGIEGLLEGDFINLTERARTQPLQYLRTTPASYLGSCRYRLPEDLGDPLYPRLFGKLRELGIGAFFYIGGNDSMDTVAKLGAYAQKAGSGVRFLGVPKTIDNDLVETDHTPGYGSTAKYVAATVHDITMDASVYKNPAITIVELMGRHAGWVTAASALARTAYNPNPLLIYLPESDFDVDGFFADLEGALQSAKSVVVCVSEGISDRSGKFICEYGAQAKLDGFGHKMLTGCGKVLEQLVRERFGCKCRSIELNLPQRCTAVLASLTDIEEADQAGRFAVRRALEGASGKMVAFGRENAGGYRVSYRLADVAKVCNREKKFPAQWITRHGTDVSPAFLDYVLPLIQGESAVPFRNGMPFYLQPAHLQFGDGPCAHT